MIKNSTLLGDEADAINLFASGADKATSEFGGTTASANVISQLLSTSL